MASRCFTLALLVAGTFAHPGALECANDLTTRLGFPGFPGKAGRMIMQKYTEKAPANAPVSVSVEGATVSITAGDGFLFVAKAFGSTFGHATLSLTSESSPNAPNLVMTKDCTNQLFLNYTNIDSPPGATYTFSQSNAEKIVVGYVSKKYGPGTVHLITVDVPKEPAQQVVPLKNANFEQLVATWEEVVNATDGGCAERGHCGIAYQGCCVAAKVKLAFCSCKLVDGNGTIGQGCISPFNPIISACAVAYKACCAAYKHKGFPCTCNIEK